MLITESRWDQGREFQRLNAASTGVTMNLHIAGRKSHPSLYDTAEGTFANDPISDGVFLSCIYL